MTDGTKTITQVITHSRCMSTISARPSKPRVKTLHSASCTRIFKTGPLVTPLKMHTPFFHLCSHRPLCLRLCTPGAQSCKLPIKLLSKATKGSQDRASHSALLPFLVLSPIPVRVQTSTADGQLMPLSWPSLS